MKGKWLYIKFMLVLAVMFFLFSFSGQRNSNRKVETIKVNFEGNQQMFITEEAVNKLLKQKMNIASNVLKEQLVLNRLEYTLNTTNEVKNAQVYVTVNGQLEVSIQQRTPIARVNADVPFYIDDEGKKMMLSKYHTARVPMVSGQVNENNLKALAQLVQAIDNDTFLKTHVTDVLVHQNQFELRVRGEKFKVIVGGVNQLQDKIDNFKAFYQKAVKDKTLAMYSKVNLKYNHQVVCTKL